MKDICVVRYPSENRMVPERVRAAVEALMLPGERAELHAVDGRTLIVEVHRSAKRSAGSQVLISPGSACAYSGHVQPRFGDLRSRGRQVAVTGNTIRLADSPGGIAAHFYVDRETGQLFAWASLSNWERVFYTAAQDLVVVSNSALLSHCLAEGTTSPRMNPAWLEDVLIGMGSLLEHTQFADTFVVPSRKSLRVAPDGEVSLADYPLPVIRHSLARGSNVAVDELLHELVFAASPLTEPDTSLFRLSSGKDSRLIAALLRSIGFIPKTVTYGEEGVQHAAIVARLAAALQMPVETTHSRQCHREKILGNIREQSRRADFAYLAAQQLVKPDDEFAGFDVVVEGHAHHLRGGYAMRRDMPRDAAFQVFWEHQNAGVEYALGAQHKKKKAMLRSVFDDMVREISPYEALYWAYVDRRVLMTQQVYRRKARTIDQVPPLMDERVILATSKAHIGDLGSEELFYKVLSRLSPVATQVPVYGKTWRFAAKVTEPYLTEGGAAGRSEKGVHKNLSVAVEVLNGLMDQGLPFDMRDLTPDAAFHGDRIMVERLKANGRPRLKTLDYVWKIVSLALTFGPKDFAHSAVRTPQATA